MKDCLLTGAWTLGCIAAVILVFASVFGVAFGAKALGEDVHPLVGALYVLSFIFVSAAALRALLLLESD